MAFLEFDRGFSGLRETANAQRLDRLGIVTILTSLYFIQIWGINLNWPSKYDAIYYTMIVVAFLGVLFPRFHVLLLIQAAGLVTYYLAVSPVASNNRTTAFALCLVILGAYAWVLFKNRGQYTGLDREAFFHAIAGPGRFILAGMYFFGIYHKINYDFLNPEVSCAVALYKPLTEDFGLANWTFGQYSAIYATFIVEGFAMIALFVPGWKRLGIAVGLLFHIAIGWTGYAYYKDFSTIVLVLYTLFLPRVAVDTAISRAAYFLGGEARALRLGRAFLFICVGLFVAYSLVFAGPKGAFVPRHEFNVWAFTVYAMIFYAFAVIFTPWKLPKDDTAGHGWPAWLLIVPLLYFVNGWSPYFGLKTESSIAMYSNLHTEGGQTNHLLHGHLPGAASYQRDLVFPIASNDPRFTAEFIGEGLALVRYEFDRMLAKRPNLQVTFQHEGILRESTDPTWDNTYRSASPWERAFLVFKPVDFNRPKVCTH